MHTLLHLDDRLVAKARAAAERQRTTLDVLVADALRRHLQAAETDALPIFRRGSGLNPDLIPPSTRALLEAASDDAPPA